MWWDRCWAEAQSQPSEIGTHITPRQSPPAVRFWSSCSNEPGGFCDRRLASARCRERISFARSLRNRPPDRRLAASYPFGAPPFHARGLARGGALTQLAPSGIGAASWLPLPTSPAFSPKFCEGLKVPSRRRCTTSAAALAGAVSPLRAHVAAAAAAALGLARGARRGQTGGSALRRARADHGPPWRRMICGWWRAAAAEAQARGASLRGCLWRVRCACGLE